MKSETLKTVADVLRAIEFLESTNKDAVASLCKLRSVARSADWETGIEQDERVVVKHLYALYSDNNDSIQSLLKLEIVNPAVVSLPD